MNKDIPAKLINDKFMEKIASGNLDKAAEVATDFTRLTLREEGILRKILPPQTITTAELDKQIDTDEPVKIVDKEVVQPLSMSVGFATLPKNVIMKGDRYRVDFARIVSPSYFQDVRRLEQYDYDIRNVFKENAVKDHMTAEDVPFFNLVNTIVQPASAPTGGTWAVPTGGGATWASPVTGKNQYYDFTKTYGNPNGSSSGLTVSNMVDALKILSKGFTPGGGTLGANQTPIRLNTDIVLMNVNTGREYLKIAHSQIGDQAEEFFKDGLTLTTILGQKHLFTIKDDIIPDGLAYFFAAPQFLGKFYELEQPTMFVDRRAFMIEFFLYSSLGCSVGNPFGVAAAKFF
jgi:hypothetical protein